MSIQKFHAYTMKEALDLVKAHMGQNAVILHTRSIRKGGVLGFGSREVVEITASDDANVLPRKKDSASGRVEVYNRAARPALIDVKPHELLERVEGVRREKKLSAPPPVLKPEPEPASKVEIEATAPKTRRKIVPRVVKPGILGSLGDGDLAAEMIRDELSTIRKMVGDVARYATRDLAAKMPENLARAYRRLVETDVSEKTAWEIVESLRNELPDPSAATEKQVEAYLAAEVKSRIKTCGTIELSGDAPRVFAFFGPTGVGKTTTIAKLAAQIVLNKKAKVGLVTVDTYRIAAVEQLRTYARIIGVPLKVVQSPEELPAVLDEYSDRDAVFVDTAGRSQRDSEKIRELECLLRMEEAAERFLVIDSTSQFRKAGEVVDRFKPARPQKIVLTKVDEAVTCGMLLDLANHSGLPVAYCTTGQEVPDDIEAAGAEALARLVLGEGV